MAHGGLGRAERYAGGAEVRAEGHTQGVDVDDTVAIVAFGDSCCGEIPIEDAAQTGRHVEEFRVRRQFGRDYCGKVNVVSG